MKKHTIFPFVGWMLFLSSNLFAQSTEGIFRLKVGDWFEVRVERNYIVTQDRPLNSPLQRQTTSETYMLNYQLKKQLSNGNQLYHICVEHFKSVKKFGNHLVGYDSYYPTWEENRKTPPAKNQFTLEVTAGGEIVNTTPFPDNSSTKKFTSIKSSYGSNIGYLYSDQVDDSFVIKHISTILMQRAQNQTQYKLENKIPVFIKTTDSRIVLTDASFSILPNTFIFGRLEDQINKKISINVIGDNSRLNFPTKQFQTDENGSFNCPISLARPLHLSIQIGNKNLTTFLELGDTLHFDEISFLARKLSPVNHLDNNKIAKSPEVFKASQAYSGSPEYNTRLANELSQYYNHFIFYEGKQSIVTRTNEIDEKVKELINRYQGKASEVCLDYFNRDWDYFLATEKIKFYEENKIPVDQRSYKDILTIKDYPADFFLAVDTMPILMNPFEWNYSYLNFLTKAQRFKQERLGYSIGRNIHQGFMNNYFFAQASLSGFPLHQQIAQSLDREYRNSTDDSFLEPYYQNFTNNCADPALKNPIEKIRNNALQIKIGNTFPIKSFALRDSAIFAFDTMKGKPICLIVASGPYSRITNYKEVIEKFKTEEVEFVFLRLHPNYLYEEKIDTAITQKSNVTVVDLYDPSLYDKLLMGSTRIFMLDKWFRIVENNAEDPMTHKYIGRISQFEKSLRKTIEAKRYSKAEKTAMIKTAGWSFGSILFTFLGGLWMYRIRIRRIKQQEAAKRRIKELEIKAIRSQMNPHFIFNALNSIQSLINGNQFKEANIYLSKFAVLLRGVLNNSEKSRISLSDELQAVELYCQLEQLRFEFKFEISIDPDVNGDLIEIPGMIIQPLAENAVVHGLSANGELGKLNIQVKRQNGNLCVCVADNGVGLSSQKMDELSQKGFGLKLVEERINILNLEGKEAKLTVENQSNATGTVATLIIPID